MSEVLAQNTLENLTKLKAQRYAYHIAKKAIAFQYLAVLILSTAGVIAAFNGFRVSWLAFLIALVDAFVIERWIKEKIKEASLIQEHFDCSVLQLPWSRTHCGTGVSPESIHRYSIAASRHENLLKKLTDWYAVEYFSMPISKARLQCQRVNIEWNLTSRKRFVFVLNLFAILVISLIFTSLVLLDMGTSTWFYQLVIPLLPLLNRMRDIWFRVQDSLSKLASASGAADRLIELSKDSETSEEALIIGARELQNEIYDIRSREIPVIDDIYWKYRNVDEEAMKASARETLSRGNHAS